MVTTKKSHLKLKSEDHMVGVVKQYRLGEGLHSNVFPQHAHPNAGSWHGGPRNGHGGSHTSPSRKSK